MTQAITLQFCAFNSAFGTIIDWFTQGLVGHVDAVLPGGALLGAQHESGLGDTPAGVQIRPANYGDTSGMRHRMRATLSVGDAEAEAFYAFLRAQVGKPYDTTAIIAFVADRNWRATDAWFCSELIAAALEEAGIVRKLVSSANKISPAALMLVLSALVEIEPYSP